MGVLGKTLERIMALPKFAWDGMIMFTFLKSRVHSLAFSPNCHLHCVSASYSSPGSFSGYRYSLTALGSSDRHKAWAELLDRGGEERRIKEEVFRK